jgi:pilus assembly protein TadC
MGGAVEASQLTVTDNSAGAGAGIFLVRAEEQMRSSTLSDCAHMLRAILSSCRAR